MVKSALAISWSDPTGCTGIAADLRTFGAFAIHGAGIIAGLHARGAITAFQVADVESQIDAAVSALGTVPAKISLIGAPAVDGPIVARLAARGFNQIVVDASSRPTLGMPSRDAIEGYKTWVASNVMMLVTDVAGAQALAAVKITNQTAMRAAAKLLHKLGPRFVLVTGSHLSGDEFADIMFDGSQTWEFPGERFAGPEPLGVSSTYAAAVTASLAHGRSPEESVAIARIYLTEAIRAGFTVTEKLPVASQLYSWWSGHGAQGYGG